MKWIATLLLIISSIAVANTELDFHLCSAYVQNSALGVQSNSGWPVYVKLSEAGAKSFERFTEANIGRISRIIVGGRVFLRATTWASVPSGNLQGEFSSQEIAKAWHRTLSQNLPSAPCGAEAAQKDQ